MSVVVAVWLLVSGAHGVEDLLRFPVGLVEHAYDTVGGDVAVAGFVVVGEGEPQRGIHAFFVEDVEQFVEVGRLLPTQLATGAG